MSSEVGVNAKCKSRSQSRRTGSGDSNCFHLSPIFEFFSRYFAKVLWPGSHRLYFAVLTQKHFFLGSKAPEKHIEEA